MWQLALVLLISGCHLGTKCEEQDGAELRKDKDVNEDNFFHNPTLSRQKRCIVVQKQSGTHGDSSGGEGSDYDEDYARQPKLPADRVRAAPAPENFSTEEELAKYKSLKKKSNNRRRYKHKRAQNGQQDGRRKQSAGTANMTIG